MNILFTCAGRRNYLINYCKDVLNGKGKVLATDITYQAPAMADADIALVVPSIYDANYITILVNIIQKYKVDALISLNDLELPILSKNKNYLESFGVKVIVSNEKVINLCFDKLKTHIFLENIGLRSVKTYSTLESAICAIKKGEINFPLVIKPRWGSGSIGMEFPESLEELHLAYSLTKIKLERTILFEASKNDIDFSLLIQEKIVGIDYCMDIVNDFSGKYFGTFVRKKLSSRSGETDKSISVIDERFERIGRIISENLKHIGVADCDLIEKDGTIYFIDDINPRFGGAYPFSHEAGINIIQAYILWLEGKSANHLKKFYKSGKAFAKCDRLVEISNFL